MGAYITEREYLDFIKSPAESGDPNLISSIAAASLAVNQHCGRTFDLSDAPTTKFFTPRNDNERWILPIEDLATLEDLAVATDAVNSGNYVARTDYIAEPVNQQRNGISGWPYDSLRVITSNFWPIRIQPYCRDTVRVTGTFGWAAVPESVKQATKILTNLYYKLGEAPFGVAGFDQFGSIRVREIPQVATLLSPFLTGDTFGIG